MADQSVHRVHMVDHPKEDHPMVIANHLLKSAMTIQQESHLTVGRILQLRVKHPTENLTAKAANVLAIASKNLISLTGNVMRVHPEDRMAISEVDSVKRKVVQNREEDLPMATEEIHLHRDRARHPDSGSLIQKVATKNSKNLTSLSKKEMRDHLTHAGQDATQENPSAESVKAIRAQVTKADR